jgi:hypothetical protein
MLRSTAVVATASTHRDTEALLALLASAPSVRVETTQPSLTCLVFPFGVAALLPGPEGLVLIGLGVRRRLARPGRGHPLRGDGDRGSGGRGPRPAVRVRRRPCGAPGGRLRLIATHRY